MKRTFLLFASLILIISSCKKDDPAINAKKDDNGGGLALGYNDSYTAWTSYKNKVNNNYSYTVAWGSFLVLARS